MGGHPLRPVGTGTPADLRKLYHGTRGRLSAGQLPLARAPSADVLCCAVAMEPLYGRSDLFANRAAQDSVSGIEALGGNHPACDVIRAQQLARRGSEHAKAEPRQFIAGEVPIAAIGALRSDRLRVEIRRENAEHAINVRQVGST
jgi:hypothetical protein